eukprot:m.134475 g.134475  ORF g.134475 m.134475 type:complete len:175 (+) comp38139_c0_seq27:2424-2948(+)
MPARAKFARQLSSEADDRENELAYSSYESLIVQGISLSRIVLLSTEYVSDSAAASKVRENSIQLHSVLVIQDDAENIQVSPLSLVVVVVADSKLAGKEVKIHLTVDGWRTQDDHKAEWIRASESGVDKFSLQVQLDEGVWRRADREDLVQFAVTLKAGGGEWWDNNRGFNYRLK